MLAAKQLASRISRSPPLIPLVQKRGIFKNLFRRTKQKNSQPQNSASTPLKQQQQLKPVQPPKKTDILPKIDPNLKSYDNFLKNFRLYQDSIKDNLKIYQIRQDGQKIQGYATSQGTQRYFERRPQKIVERHFRSPFNQPEMKLSSIGVGTYIGAPDDETDFHMYSGIKGSVMSGAVNVIDTAINYRYMKSERTVGKAIKTLVDKYGYQRDELFISSKIGYVPEDTQNGIPGRILIQDLISQGKIKEQDVSAKVLHCMHPNYLEEQLNQSLKNLDLATLDLMYLHNAMQSQGPFLTKDQFFDRLAKAFEWFQAKVQENKIRNYGLATWICFRSKENQQGLHLNFQEVVQVAQKVGGKDTHNFRYVQVFNSLFLSPKVLSQLPINAMMNQAFLEPWQQFKMKDKSVTKWPTITSAHNLKINLQVSQPLLQGHLLKMQLSNQFLVRPNSCRHLQFARSVPSSSIKNIVVGMKQMRHVNQNLRVAQVDPLTMDQFFQALKPDKKSQPYHEPGMNDEEQKMS